MPILATLALIVLPGAAAGAAVSDAVALAMTRPQEQIVASDIGPKRLATLLKPVNAFYGFWINGSATLSPADAQEFLSGEMYVNVHTKANPGGEIRGQVLHGGP